MHALQTVKEKQRVRVKLKYCPYTHRQAGVYSGVVEAHKGDRVLIWVRIKGHGAADGFLTGSNRVDETGAWIEGVAR
ncbi:hypothetical protein LKL35_29275 [Streptomyces sp. ET3-23]|uniref:hypothetical protein n=1 Tax=Streptomyces sp. ET3-23 TaxID=2885643 RepID=UPI001D10241E|nr:hypothetical protein [Streptomyces sp. ET3-23]MCC2279491.1 hypothetical protein [Streptomyces sp. ET3-23]